MDTKHTGGGEAIGLDKLCESVMRFPAIDPKVGDGQLTKQLKSWIVGRKTEAIVTRQLRGQVSTSLSIREHLYAGLESHFVSLRSIDPSRRPIRSFKIEATNIVANGSLRTMRLVRTAKVALGTS